MTVPTVIYQVVGDMTPEASTGSRAKALRGVPGRAPALRSRSAPSGGKTAGSALERDPLMLDARHGREPAV